MAVVTAYLAGPDVFLPAAAEHARRKVVICAAYGFEDRAPVDDDAGHREAVPDDQAAWRAIYARSMAMMEACDCVIANLTPFRGASADAGTRVELGWFLGRGRPVFGYSNAALPFAERSHRQVAAVPDPMPGLTVEGFGLPDTLMIPSALANMGPTLRECDRIGSGAGRSPTSADVHPPGPRPDSINSTTAPAHASA